MSDFGIGTKYVLIYKEIKGWGGGHIHTMDNTTIPYCFLMNPEF